jgi:hypothetical protein
VDFDSAGIISLLARLIRTSALPGVMKSTGSTPLNRSPGAGWPIHTDEHIDGRLGDFNSCVQEIVQCGRVPKTAMNYAEALVSFFTGITSEANSRDTDKLYIRDCADVHIHTNHCISTVREITNRHWPGTGVVKE